MLDMYLSFASLTGVFIRSFGFSGVLLYISLFHDPRNDFDDYYTIIYLKFIIPYH